MKNIDTSPKSIDRFLGNVMLSIFFLDLIKAAKCRRSNFQIHMFNFYNLLGWLAVVEWKINQVI